VKLLAVGEALGGTGYGRVMESVLAPLSRSGVEVVLFAVDFRGGASDLPFVVRPNEVPGDNYGVEQLPRLLEEVDPDVVLLHRNAPFFSMHRDALAGFRARRPDARVVVYSPADRPVRDLHASDLVVFYTQTGLEAAGEGLPSAAVIPHGVDHDRFFPVPDARERLFPELPDAFIVLNANRNERRKRVDVTMRGFAPFAAGRPDAWLYLHMGMRDLGIDLLELAESLGISDRLLVTTFDARHPQVSDERLNLIYNACDVGVNTAASEGWGLVAFEHAATGAAQLVPGHGACLELWRDAGVLLQVEADASGRQVTTPSAVTDALARLYDDRSLLASRSASALEHARSERFSWPSIAQQWEELLRGCRSAAE
jgi:glycosyltransferase involved in cell wall biosynthesis